MSKRILTDEKQKELTSNNNVERCSAKSITYTTAFKTKAIQQYNMGLTAREIFKHAGLDIHVIGRDIPNDCLRRWRKIHKEKGIQGLCEVRGNNGIGRTKNLKRSKDEQMKYLEAEVKYLKAENAFLAQLRAKRE